MRLFGVAPSLWPALAFGIWPLLLGGCDAPSSGTPVAERGLGVRQVQRLIPERDVDRLAWAGDIMAVMQRQSIDPTLTNVCSIVAVVDQESNFVANPQVPGLGAKASREIRERLEEKLGPLVARQFEKMLNERPSPQDSFAKRLQRVHSEKELDELYREIFDYFKGNYRLGVFTGAAQLVVGQDLAEYFNPVKTLGSMQVHINYALANPQAPSRAVDVRNLLYTREGGLYYGIHRLMHYPARYNRPIYRFADYNSGLYASRNAAFQKALNRLLGDAKPLALDGDLLLYGKDGDALPATSSTELALRRWLLQEGLVVGDAPLRRQLLKEKSADFERTEIWARMQQAHRRRFGSAMPYAIMPQVTISGPKLSRDHNTQWYATNVDRRYQRCMTKGRQLGLR